MSQSGMTCTNMLLLHAGGNASSLYDNRGISIASKKEAALRRLLGTKPQSHSLTDPRSPSNTLPQSQVAEHQKDPSQGHLQQQPQPVLQGSSQQGSPSSSQGPSQQWPQSQGYPPSTQPRCSLTHSMGTAQSLRLPGLSLQLCCQDHSLCLSQFYIHHYSQSHALIQGQVTHQGRVSQARVSMG